MVMDKPAESKESAVPPISAHNNTAHGSITLVRHGEPALSRKILFNAKGYGDWWAIYEVGGIKDPQSPPPAVAARVQSADILLVSTRRRSHESMQLLAAGREYAEHEVFIEAPLPPPPFPGWIHFSPRIWGFLTRFWWWFFNHYKDGESRAEAHLRSDDAARILIDRANGGKSVVLVAHGFFNVMIEKSLISMGWHRTWHEGGFRYWSTRHFEKL